MECVFVFGMALVAFILMIAFLVSVQSRTRAWNVVYEAVSKRYSASHIRATWLTRPTIRMRYGQTTATVTTYRGREGEINQIHMQWPDRGFRVEITSPGFISTLRARGMRDVAIDPDFDRHHRVRTNNAEEALKMLSPGVIWQLEQLRAFSQPNEVYVALNRGSLVIRRIRFIRRVDQLDQFVRSSLELFDQAMLTQSVGIEFVNPETAQLLENPHCQVCNEEIADEIVFCSRCRTAHCRECWVYTGVCSTFACGETQYVLPMVARPRDEANSDRIELE